MERRLESRIRSMVEELSRDYQKELEAAGTLVDLEDLTGQIGDEFARQLCERELVCRGQHAAADEWRECPECGAACCQTELEPVVLQGLRGEVGFNQPSYYCRRCRRSFFPSSRAIGTFDAKHGDAQDSTKDGVGRKQSRRI